MRMKPVTVFSVVIVALASAQGAHAQNKPPAPAATTNAPAPAIATYTLPNGAVARTVNGVTCYSFGGAYYRPYYSGSSVFYEVVANPA